MAAIEETVCLKKNWAARVKFAKEHLFKQLPATVDLDYEFYYHEANARIVLTATLVDRLPEVSLLLSCT